MEPTKKNKISISFLIISFVLFLSLFFAGRVLFLYNQTFSTISESPSNWGHFGSLLAGVFGLVGALATIATLLFIRHQHAISVKHQEKVFNEQKELIKTQTSYFDNQNDLYQVQKYQLHKEVFYKCIQNIENSLGIVKFQSMDELYSDIFTNNTISNVETRVVLSESEYKDEDSILNDISKSCRDIVDGIESFDRYDTEKAGHIIDSFYTILTLLDFSFTDDADISDVTVRDKQLGLYLCNVHYSLSFMNRLIQPLFHFCQLESPFLSVKRDDFSKFNASVVDFIKTNDNSLSIGLSGEVLWKNSFYIVNYQLRKFSSNPSDPFSNEFKRLLDEVELCERDSHMWSVVKNTVVAERLERVELGIHTTIRTHKKELRGSIGYLIGARRNVRDVRCALLNPFSGYHR